MKVPSSYFKFVTKERTDILSNGVIRFTPPNDFNDPFELNPTVTHLTKCWIRHLNRLSSKPSKETDCEFSESDYRFSIDRHNRLDEYTKRFRQYANKYGILSLSASYDTNPNPAVFLSYGQDPRRNLLMWSHYSGNHTGFVIEFSPDFVQDKVHEVVYTDERPTLSFEDIDSGSSLSFLHKSTEWAYENEWRCFKNLDDADNEPSDGVHLFRFNKRSIKSVTFGCRASKKTKESVINIIKTDPEYKHVCMFFAGLSKHSFSMEFHQETHCGERIFSNASNLCIENIALQKLPGSF